MFHRANLNKKNFATSNSDGRQPADSWECPRAVCDLQWALANLAEVYANLWPLDGSIRVIQRVLIRYEFAARLGTSEKDRCRIVEEFCDRLLCKNASRAARGIPFVGYETAKNRWRDAVEREPTAKPTESSQTTGPSNQQARQNKNDGGANTGNFNNRGNRGRGSVRGNIRGGWQARNAVAEFQGNPVCFHYNNKPVAGKPTGCTRPLAGSGCDNGRGGIYAHVCNYHFGNSVFCLQPHTRFSNH